MAKPYLSYSIGDSHGILLLDSIVEIYRVVGFDPFEAQPKRVIGYCSYRGQPLYGLDIRDLYSIDEHIYDADANLIISSVLNVHFGILVDNIGHIMHLDESQEMVREHIPAFIKDRCILKAYSVENIAYYEADLLSLFTDEERGTLIKHASQIESLPSQIIE
jgi:chemotaxis signal transduction protein